ncbi:hypothetical protein [Paenalcaligenes faecalis]|uniref:hypothetical protein n=1 Tax=Paenalcaligenes faecalis TaxID=2980099 RepID=UPI0022B96D82|nr:hypothetical protein [Paenalcaligenes faecalis]
MKVISKRITAVCFLTMMSALSCAETLHIENKTGSPTVILRTKPHTPTAPQPRQEYDAGSMIIAPTIQLDNYGGKVIHGQSQTVRPPHPSHHRPPHVRPPQQPHAPQRPSVPHHPR